jgi:hypothetical protein
MPTRFRTAALCCVALAAVLVAGCAKKLQQSLGLPNRPPTVQLTSAFVPTGDVETVTARLRWSATDPDGRVDHYLVTEDLGALSHETEGWARTIDREQLIRLRRASPLRASPAEKAAPPFRLFAVRAVDDRGAISSPACRAFFGDNVAPTVMIIDPWPSRLISPSVPPSFTIRWVGSDPDGPDGRPRLYKYKLYEVASIPTKWIVTPDSMVADLAPAFAGWDSVKGTVTELQLENLTVGLEYLFAITAIDAHGAYDPVFALDKNLLRFFVVKLGSMGPRITLFNDFFNYTYPSGGYHFFDGPSIEAPVGRPFTVNWYAQPPVGSITTGYRWLLDPAGSIPVDSIQRKKPADVHNWSAWSIAPSVTLGPFQESDAVERHALWVEARDNTGLVSLGSVQFRLVSPSFTRDLLIIDDTRLVPDQILSLSRPDTLKPPTGNWPSRAELDTFLFAVGGVRWRMTPSSWPYYLGMSPPGIFKGYPFDTLGTRLSLENPTFPLSVLSQYRHVIWMTDLPGSQFDRVMSWTQPITSLRYMSRQQTQNSLATWVQAGGELWALGGGFGNATNTDWNNPNGEGDKITRTYSSVDPPVNPDLKPGRFMYDLAHWRSEFKVLPNFNALKVTRIDQRDPMSGVPPPEGDWSGEPLRDPRFTTLPTRLMFKVASSDPVWPNRTSGSFYVGSGYSGVDLEFLSQENHIIEVEAKNPSPVHREEFQTLDTLYLAYGMHPAMLQTRLGEGVNACMTYYHGRDCGPVLFTGFDIWHWTRADCVQLVDAVLHGLWGLSRTAQASAASPVRPAGKAVARR